MTSIDRSGSAKARAEGNSAFRSGRWALAIEHYTRAIQLDPSDPVSLSNRAQAYLKLEEYELAEKDCNDALKIQPASVKALYRRALARRGLNRLQDALEDIQAALKLEKNETLKTEEAEISALLQKPDTSQSSSQQPVTVTHTSGSVLAQKSPNSDPVTHEESTTTSPISILPSSSKLESTATSAVETTQSEKAKDGFATLRKTRDMRKTRYASKPSLTNFSDRDSTTMETPFQPLTGSTSRPSSRSTITTLQLQSQPPIATESASTRAPSSSSITPWRVPTEPTSLAPGSGLRLLRSLNGSPEHDYFILRHYPPSNIGRILNSVLEPDGLGMVLCALDHGLSSVMMAADKHEAEKDKEKEIVKMMLQSLKRTSRWKMNLAMLSRNERQAGERVWIACGGEEIGTFHQ